MKKLFKYTVIIAITIGLMAYCTSVYRVVQDPYKYGIIGIEGWKHGVAICEEGEEDADKEEFSEGTMWMKDGIFYTINKGHMDDFEVGILQEMARQRCSELEGK